MKINKDRPFKKAQLFHNYVKEIFTSLIVKINQKIHSQKFLINRKFPHQSQISTENHF